jgi:hypothetical protein
VNSSIFCNFIIQEWPMKLVRRIKLCIHETYIGKHLAFWRYSITDDGRVRPKHVLIEFKK